MTAAWQAALRKLDADLDACVALLDEVERGGASTDASDPGERSVAAWQPPTGLGPLPAELGDEAARVLARTTAVQARVAAGRARLGAALDDAGRRRTAADRYHAQAGVSGLAATDGGHQRPGTDPSTGTA